MSAGVKNETVQPATANLGASAVRRFIELGIV
jgi:hypothetical protein